MNPRRLVFARSADRHGVTHEDVLYAIQHPWRVTHDFAAHNQDTSKKVTLVVGFDRNSRLLEILIGEESDRDVVFHAMKARKQYISGEV